MKVNFPIRRMANVAAITITSPDLAESLKFYQQLGFREVLRSPFPFTWIQITDGALLIMLRLDSDPYIGLTYYSTKIDSVVPELKDKGLAISETPAPEKGTKRYEMQSPDGHHVTLLTHVHGFTQPAGANLLQMSKQDYMDPDKYENKTCGIFGELAYPVADLDASISFWSKLGLVVISRFTAPHPWAILSDGLAAVGLHQTTDFTQPTITYFAKDMKEKIEKLQSTGIKEIQTAKGQSSVTLSTPEHQRINLFKIGV
jgi:catechol 2,3-dioxygenase-like lactoylglutathione lyase family enzyme